MLLATKPEKYHPRLQVRILKVNGTELGSGAHYNVVADDIVRGNLRAARASLGKIEGAFGANPIGGLPSWRVEKP